MQAGRAAALATASILAGAVFGLMAGAGAGILFMADLCAILGGAVGLVTAPLFVWGFWQSSGWGALVAVFATTGAVAFLAGLATPPNGAPFLAMAAAVGVYVSASLGVGLATRRKLLRRDQPPRCGDCGYSLIGLTGRCCPECGSALPDSSFLDSRASDLSPDAATARRAWM